MSLYVCNISCMYSERERAETADFQVCESFKVNTRFWCSFINFYTGDVDYSEDFGMDAKISYLVSSTFPIVWCYLFVFAERREKY